MVSSLASWALDLFHGWKRLQISYYGGKYSIHRALALEAYTRNTSLFHVLFVCLKCLAPMISLVVAQEMIPLQDPKEGWHKNYGFWIRASIGSLAVTRSLIIQATYFVDDAVMSPCRQVLMLACATIGVTACSMGLVSLLTFPVPFYMVVIAPASSMIQFISFRIAAGTRVLRQILQHRDQLLRFINFVSVQTTMVFLYPAYEALFRATQSSRYQVAVIFILPLMKVGLKNAMLRFTLQLEDITPEAVIFSADFFNALYMATCMQTATSISAIAAITVTDIMQTTVVLYSLNHRTATIRTRLREAVDPSLPCGNVLDGIALMCRDLEKFEKQARADIRVRSCLAHNVSSANEDLIEKLDKVPRMAVPPKPPQVGPSGKLCWFRCRKHNTNAVFPVNPGSVVVQNLHWVETPVIPNRSTILKETLEMLFTTECLILTAFLEAVIPFLYCGYIFVMVHLPSARYHSEMTGINRENVDSKVRPVFVFGLLQAASFVALAAIVKRNCGVGAPQQLAFVLETQMSLVTSKLMFWAVVTLSFRVVHFGIDFTFKFNWT